MFHINLKAFQKPSLIIGLSHSPSSNSVHRLQSCSLEIHFNIIPPHTLKCSRPVSYLQVFQSYTLRISKKFPQCYEMFSMIMNYYCYYNLRNLKCGIFSCVKSVKTSSMEEEPSLEANRNHLINSRPLRNLKFHYRVHKTPIWGLILIRLIF